MADKPENHLAIAAYYRTLAGDALAEAEKHKAMRNTYRHDHQKFKPPVWVPLGREAGGRSSESYRVEALGWLVRATHVNCW